MCDFFFLINEKFTFLKVVGGFGMDSEQLTLQEAANLLGVKINTASRCVRQGKLKPCYIGEFGNVFFEKYEVLEFKRRKKLVKNRKRELPRPSPKRSYDEMKIIEKWRVQTNDNSSVDVEIGLLSDKIERIEEQLKFFQGDNAGFRKIRMSLLITTNKRRKNLDFLRNTDTIRYNQALKKLGLNV